MPQMRELALKGSFCLERVFSLFLHTDWVISVVLHFFSHQPVWWLHFSCIWMVWIPHKAQENPDLEQEGEEVQILSLGKDLMGSCYLLPPSLRSQDLVRTAQWYFFSSSVMS